jgi:hypothetical protein
MSPGAVRALAQVLVVVGAAGCLVPTPQEPETAAVEIGSSESSSSELGSIELGSSELEARSDLGPAEGSTEVAASTPQEPDEAASQPATPQVSEPEVAPGPASPSEPEATPLVLPDPAPEDVPSGGGVPGTAAPRPPELDGGFQPSEAANPALTVAEMPADTVARREQPSDPAARAVKEVREVVNRYYEAYGARDWYKANQEFWPTATVTSLMPQKDGMPQDGGPLGVVVLPADEYFTLISNRSAATGTTGVARLAEEPQLQAAGILAQVWCHYGGRYGEEEDVMKWHRFDAFTLLLHDNTWKIAALVVGPKSDRGPKPDAP